MDTPSPQCNINMLPTIPMITVPEQSTPEVPSASRPTGPSNSTGKSVTLHLQKGHKNDVGYKENLTSL